jgi:hypothetical protein
MTNINKTFITAALITLLASPAFPQVYKCKDSSGKTIYSDIRCAPTAEIIPKKRLNANVIETLKPQEDSSKSRVTATENNSPEQHSRPNTAEINHRYDILTNEVTRMFGAKGQGNLAKLLVKIEQNRNKALSAEYESPNSDSINSKYDQLKHKIKNMYGPEGQGNLAIRLVELEASRDAALYDMRTTIPQEIPGKTNTDKSNLGVIDPKTGKFYAPAAGGVIDPETGNFYPDTGSGYLDPKTGRFIPK